MSVYPLKFSGSIALHVFMEATIVMLNAFLPLGANSSQLIAILQFRFVVMGNMFCTELRIHRRFDLKGSSLGRSTDKIEIDENTTLKDLDLNYRFYLEPTWREALLK